MVLEPVEEGMRGFLRKIGGSTPTSSINRDTPCEMLHETMESLARLNW